MRILLIEDTADLAEGVVGCLARMGHAVDWAADGVSGDQMLSEASYDLAILDLMLPGMDGIAVLKRLRARRSQIAVLVLTARSAIDDRVDVLDIGADDYLVKPFDFRELEARVRSLLRRQSGERSSILSLMGIYLDRSGRAASVNGAPIHLTRRELSLLEILLSSSSRIFGKAELLDQIFGYSGDATENAVEVLVTRLRRKIEGSGAQIETHRGLGYRLSPE